MRIGRFWRTLGLRGVLSLLVAASVFGFSLYVWHTWRETGAPTNVPLAPALVAALALVPILLTWGRYSRTGRTAHSDDVLAPLLASQEEYCLILRPFGSDGEIILGRGRGGFTAEQLVARAARKVLGFKAYAMVDQDRRLAPPGPVYMRAPHDRWQPAVQALIRRAHSIIMILPPGEDIRHSFQWEIEQITRLGMQARVIVVLPPPGQDAPAYTRSLQQACLILAAFEEFAGTIDEVDSLRVHHWEMTLSERTILLKYIQDTGPVPQELRCWEAPKRMPRRTRYKIYERALEAALATTRSELADLDFSMRYR